jgi:hypothetical protein
MPVAMLAAAAGPAVFAAVNAPAASADGPDCQPLVIGIGGSQERYMESQGAHTIIEQQLDYYAGQGYQTENVDYDSSIWPEGPYSHDESVADGTAKASQMIADYRAYCPTGEVTVVGHSLGTEVADNVAPQADHVVVYGDPDHGNGVFSQLPGIYPGASNRGVTPVPANEKDVCHQYDWVCDAPQPWTDPVGFGLAVQGYLSGWHYYGPGEDAGTAEGTETVVPEPSPNPGIPQSTPTGLPAVPPPLAAVPPLYYGPLPSVQDIQPELNGQLPPAPALPNLVQLAGEAQQAISSVVAQVQEVTTPAPAPAITVAPEVQAIPDPTPVIDTPAPASVQDFAPAPMPDVAAQVQQAVNDGVQNAVVQVQQAAGALGIRLP